MIPPVKADPNGSVRDLWRARLGQHTMDYYRGRPLLKMPEDLRTYQHLIWETRPDVIVELGTHSGGSALWFADTLHAFFGRGHVHTIDIDYCDLDDPRVTVHRGDLREYRSLLPDLTGQRVLVVEDSAHVYSTTAAALEQYSDLVTKGSWFVVEDAIVDTNLSIWGDGVGGVERAIADFLASPQGARFVRHDLALYGLTTDPGGWLEAIA